MQESWFQTALRGDIVARSAKTALVVGSILALINHGDALLAGAIDTTRGLKIVLTYFVPYAVATWASVQTARA